MHLSPTTRRRVSVAAGGAVVLGSGMSVGILAADMQHSWAMEQAVRDLAAVSAAASAEVPEPVIVTVTKTRHVTPEPVVVHKKVYRTVRAKPSAKQVQRRAPAAKASKKSGGSSSSRRTVVAPAPAPAKATAPAPSSTTSKTS